MRLYFDINEKVLLLLDVSWNDLSINHFIRDKVNIIDNKDANDSIIYRWRTKR